MIGTGLNDVMSYVGMFGRGPMRLGYVLEEFLEDFAVLSISM